MRKDFCVFILSHGRPNVVKTLPTLIKGGYTGDWYIVIDNEDKTAPQYYENFGRDHVKMFNKLQVSKTFDTADNFNNRKCIVFARNKCWDLARRLGYSYFIQLDDDYVWFGFRGETRCAVIPNLDLIFTYLVEFLENTPESVKTICFSQGGDHIGGFDSTRGMHRKAMNSFVCKTDRQFQFLGTINEDVNTYVRLGGVGDLFFTVWNIQLTQVATQTNSGGITDFYLTYGTYVKSFYTVMMNPSCVSVKMMSAKNPRLHHSINWGDAVPCILPEKCKKF